MKYYYILRGIQDHEVYVDEHGGERHYNMGSAKLFSDATQAEEYRMTLKKASKYEVYKVNPRVHCLSSHSCDDCDWGGPCPRHSY